MVPFKGKAAQRSGFRILEDPQASHSSAKGSRIYPRAPAQESRVVDPSRKSTTGIPMGTSRKSAPPANKAHVKLAARDGLNSGKVTKGNTENHMGKCDNSARISTQRKALADVSNMSNDRRVQLRSRLSSDPKIMKDKTERNDSLQGNRANGGRNRGPRVSLNKSILLPSASSGKYIGVKARRQDDLLGKNDSPGGMHVKARGGKKALFGVSNVDKDRRYQLRHHLSSGPKLMKEKTEGSNSSQSKANNGRNPFAPRNSLTTIAVEANASSRNPVRQTARGSIEVMGKTIINNESRLRRKGLSAVSSYRSFRRIQSTDGSKLTLSLTARKVGGHSTSSRKSIKPRSKVTTSTVNQRSTLEKSITSDASVSKGVPPGLNCEDSAFVVSKGCASKAVEFDGGCYSGDNMTVVISRPKHRRRRSYTLSLMAKSEIMGGDYSDCVKKEELPSIDDNANPLEVVEYVDDIYQYYWTMEMQNPLLADYMTIQAEITPRMRGILTNWLIEVHLKYELMQETLFLMVELLDRVLSLVKVKRSELQMVGLTALLLASKYEDFWHPKINELISISANSYTRDQFLSMEKLMLSKLRFRLNIPTRYVFMLRFLKAAQSERKLEQLAFYLIELSLVEYEALTFKPSLLCASAIYVARCTLQLTPAWTELLKKHAHYEESELRNLLSLCHS